MPGRYIREGILTSEPVDKLSPAAELFFRRLMSVVDDYGRYQKHPSLLRAALFPLRLEKVSNDNVEAWLAECEAAGLIESFESSGKACLEILKFEQRRRTESRLPREGDNGYCPTTVSKPRTSDGQMRSSTRPSTRPSTKTSTITSTDSDNGNVGARPALGLVEATLRQIEEGRAVKDSGFVFDRSDLLGSARAMLGEVEWGKNSRMWTKRAKTDPIALGNALEDFAVRLPQERAKITHTGKWLTSRFGECQKELRRED